MQRILLYLSCATLAASCASKSPSADPVFHLQEPSSSASIAEQLIEAAELRANPNNMRVLVHFRTGDDSRLAPVTSELERELITSLTGRLHLFDSGLTSNTVRHDLEALVERLDVTHALVCDTALKHDRIVLSLRLVEHDSLRIVASAQGGVPLTELSDESRLALMADNGSAEEFRMASSHRTSIAAAEPEPEPTPPASTPRVEAEAATESPPERPAEPSTETVASAQPTEGVTSPPRTLLPPPDQTEIESLKDFLAGIWARYGRLPGSTSESEETPTEGSNSGPRGPSYYRLQALGYPVR